MLCSGVDLRNPVDRMPEGGFPYLSNIRVVEEGRLESRPGYTNFNPTATSPATLHSIRRLNDPDDSFASAGYTYLVGAGTSLLAGIETALASISTGYSGNPLSLIPFRPDVAPESWMYVYDANKQVKVRPDGTVRAVGAVPPNAAPDADYGIPAIASVTTGQNTTLWGTSGATTPSAPTLVSRLPALATFTIDYILYDSGTTGWCSFFLLGSGTGAGDFSWAGERMRLILNTGGGSEETVVVREIRQGITSTTISSIRYDSGSTGLCTMVLVGSPVGLERNSLIGNPGTGEHIRVLSVTPSPDGTTYSLRCSTTNTYAAGATITGHISWRAYTISNHVATEPVSSFYLLALQPAAGTGAMARTSPVNAGATTNGRPVSLSDDYLHCSIFLSRPANVVTLSLLIDIDPDTSAATAITAFTNNYLQWDLPQSALGDFSSSSANVWVEVVVPLSQATRHGNNLSLNLTTIGAVAVGMVSSAACNYGFDWWYVFGTYGPTILTNAPTGYFYSSRFRDSTTGNASVPGPATRYDLRPLREDVLVTPAATTVAGIDYEDIYRLGGSITGFVYIGSVKNNNASPNTFTDDLADITVSANPAPDLTLIQPWPILGLPLTGTCNVIGTRVIRVSGSTFPTTLVSNSIILLNGVAYLTYGQPTSTTVLNLNESGGTQSGITFSIASPTLAGQSLPFVFGPLEGPLAPVIFGLGDPINGGNLYFTNVSSADAASDQNTVELCSPSEPLISGATWNGLVICGSRSNLFLLRYSYLQTSPYQFNRIPAASGIWSRWACCRGPKGVYYLGSDGIYLASESQSINITDPKLYPLFPHDGQAASTAGVNGLFPVDMTQLSKLRLACCDQDIYFDYLDINGDAQTLRYEINQNRWFPHNYPESAMGGIATHYFVELPDAITNRQQMLMLGRSNGFIQLSGGNIDNATTLTATFLTPCYDGGDERAQKLYVDLMSDMDGTGTVSARCQFDDNITNGATFTMAPTGSRAQFLQNLASLSDLSLYRNVSLRGSFTGGPAGPRIYAWEPSGYIQPYLSTSLVTQFLNLDYQGWKHSRRLYPGIISTGPVLLTIQTDDGRSFGPYTIPSTGGRYRIQPQMLDQNIKFLAAAFQVTSTARFAFFPDSFTLETKEWKEPDYLEFALFRA